MFRTPTPSYKKTTGVKCKSQSSVELLSRTIDTPPRLVVSPCNRTLKDDEGLGRHPGRTHSNPPAPTPGAGGTAAVLPQRVRKPLSQNKAIVRQKKASHQNWFAIGGGCRHRFGWVAHLRNQTDKSLPQAPTQRRESPLPRST